MSRVLEQIDKVLEPTDMDDTPVGIDMEQASFAFEEKLFNNLLDFVGTLEPDQLTDDQLLELWNIVNSLNPTDGLSEVEILDRTTPEQRKNARLYKRRSRDKIREWKNKVGEKLRRNRKKGKGVKGGMLGQSRRRDVV